MKLKDWADKTGVKYLTAYRWFKAGTLPVKAYQTDSGTIIVEGDSEELLEKDMPVISSGNNDVISSFIKKTVEFSKENSSIEDFAAWVLSNFSLKFNHTSDSPKYSRNKPKPEEIQKHFQKFIPKNDKPKPNVFVSGNVDNLDLDGLDSLVATADSLSPKELVSEISKFAETTNTVSPSSQKDLYNDLTAVFSGTPLVTNAWAPQVKTYGSVSAGSSVNRNDLSLNNYTCSTTTSTQNLPHNINPLTDAQPDLRSYVNSAVGATGSFRLTQKEMDSATKSLQTTPLKKRGRKPSKSKE